PPTHAVAPHLTQRRGAGTDELPAARRFAPARPRAGRETQTPAKYPCVLRVRGIRCAVTLLHIAPGAGHALRRPARLARADLRADRRPGHLRRRLRGPGA